MNLPARIERRAHTTEDKLDVDIIYKTLWDASIGELLNMLETGSSDVTVSLFANQYKDAIMSQDINAMTTIIKRVEGLPRSKDDDVMYDTPFTLMLGDVLSRRLSFEEIGMLDEVETTCGEALCRKLILVANLGGKIYRDQARNLINDYMSGKRTKPNQVQKMIEIEEVDFYD